uniref:4'-phosphopantetheinyl transferase superfamily protein n=1 Tax=Schlesneria paludicola TaxID=360056 RepID=A0A7C2NZD0_9PLAN
MPSLFTPDADWPAWPSASVVDRTAIHVVRLWMPDGFPRYHALLALLSPDEKARAERFLIDIVRQRFVVCRATLRLLLAGLCDCAPTDIAFDYGPHGKPLLSSLPTLHSPLSFNVSHADDVALFAIGWSCELGVDVERSRDHDWRNMARRFFATAEWEQLQRLPTELQHAAFCRVWTCKEAYMKATGQGMSLPLGSFAVCADPRLPPRLLSVQDQPSEVERWQMSCVDPAPDFAGAVMWDGAMKNVQRWTWHLSGPLAPVRGGEG